MKITLRFLVFLLICFQSCGPSDSLYFEGDYRPELLTRIDLERSVFYTAAKATVNPREHVSNSKYLFVLDKYHGIHVYDLSLNPAQKIGFINAPGCTQLDISTGNLIFNNAVDVITADVKNISDFKVIKRGINLLPELLPPDLEYIPNYAQDGNRPANMIIVGWTLRK